MGTVSPSSNFQNCIKKTNKIPDYAKDFENEYLFIIGINKKCGEFINKLDFGGDLFNSPQANNLKFFINFFLKAQELGYLKDVSGFYLKYYDVNKIDCLEDQLDDYCDLYFDPDRFEFDKEYYDWNVERDYPGFKELFELVSLFNDKVKREELTFSDFMSNTSSLSFDSDSD